MTAVVSNDGGPVGKYAEARSAAREMQEQLEIRRATHRKRRVLNFKTQPAYVAVMSACTRGSMPEDERPKTPDWEDRSMSYCGKGLAQKAF